MYINNIHSFYAISIDSARKKVLPDQSLRINTKCENLSFRGTTENFVFRKQFFDSLILVNRQKINNDCTVLDPDENVIVRQCL